MFHFAENQKNISVNFSSTAILLNIISCISYVIYIYFYVKDVNLQIPPSKILICLHYFIYIYIDSLSVLKMTAEFLLSFFLILYFLGIYLYEAQDSHFLTHISSFFIPSTLVCIYYFNACSAQNLYLTFYNIGVSYSKRYRLYKYIGWALALITLILCLILNQNQPVLLEVYSYNYYDQWFIMLVNILGLLVMVYTGFKLYYITQRDDNYLTYFDSPDINKSYSKLYINIVTVMNHISIRKRNIESLIKKKIINTVMFFVCFAPNNLIFLLQTMESNKICNFNCNYFSIFLYLLSLSCFFSIIIKTRDPYIKENIYLFLYRIFNIKPTQVKLIYNIY